MNYLEVQALQRQIQGDAQEFSGWLLQKGKPITLAHNASGKLHRSVSAFDQQRCAYIGLDVHTVEAALYKQFRIEKAHKQQLNAPPKPRDYSNLNKELFQSDSNASLLEQLNALKAEVNRLKGGQQS